MTYGGTLDSCVCTPKVDGRPPGPPLRVVCSSWLGGLWIRHQVRDDTKREREWHRDCFVVHLGRTPRKDTEGARDDMGGVHIYGQQPQRAIIEPAKEATY